MRKDWIEIELGKVCDVISGKTQKKIESPDGKYPIYGSGGIFGNQMDGIINELNEVLAA